MSGDRAVAIGAAALALVALLASAVGSGSGAVPAAMAALLGLAAALALAWRGTLSFDRLVAALVIVHAGVAILLHALPAVAADRPAGAAYWCALAAAWLDACALVSAFARHSGPASRRPWLRTAPPILFGLWVLILWEILTRGLGVPFVLLPPPSAVAERLAVSLPILAADFRQTFLKAVLAGYALGCGTGFLVALAADRIGFLRRGLLPVANLASALPIIGVAPIMVMWFGFDWQSKAAVVAVMTFFPMLVNTLAGLNAAGRLERDLMRTYGASHRQELVKARLPAALPFVFNALKINATLALIGAIVAEFFGTPVVGMGFRISTEVGRMNIDMVWAEIAMAAAAGSAFYGLIGLVERRLTFWHPSVRS